MDAHHQPARELAESLTEVAVKLRRAAGMHFCLQAKTLIQSASLELAAANQRLERMREGHYGPSRSSIE